jgi:hypothetical protein
MRWIAILAAVVVIAVLGIWQRAAAQGAVAVRPVTPRVLAGGDFGFRVEGVKGDTPVGRLVVQVNGQWVPVEVSSAVPRLLSAR